MLQNIEAERGRLQLTKKALSAKLGITQKTYSSYIKGGPIPSDILIQMSKVFGCTIDYLLGLDEKTA